MIHVFLSGMIHVFLVGNWKWKAAFNPKTDQAINWQKSLGKDSSKNHKVVMVLVILKKDMNVSSHYYQNATVRALKLM